MKNNISLCKTLGLHGIYISPKILELKTTNTWNSLTENADEYFDFDEVTNILLSIVRDRPILLNNKTQIDNLSLVLFNTLIGSNINSFLIKPNEELIIIT